MLNPGSEKKRITWGRERDVALLTQIISTGIRAFVTSKANTKAMREEEKFNQGDAWTNAEDGILTMLWKHEAFQVFSSTSKYTLVYTV
ncbi:hypothetical protein AB1Y20_020842 [Prymnesium parvum]|uniref:FACT complex subunit n=1 Tax=Prymnesium parvum TaxID=97485 RepID=A0AB34JZ96_PRYPA